MSDEIELANIPPPDDDRSSNNEPEEVNNPPPDDESQSSNDEAGEEEENNPPTPTNTGNKLKILSSILTVVVVLFVLLFALSITGVIKPITSTPIEDPPKEDTPKEDECEYRVKAPVTLKLSNDTTSKYPQLSLTGGNSSSINDKCADIKWVNQGTFWYLEVQPISATEKVCATQGGGNFVAATLTDESPPATCNIYDFRVLINNNLTEPSTMHFHGLTPPTNEDGVPFVTTPNIESKSIQYYRFQQLTYPGMYWMHSHWGFHEAYGIDAPIVFQHNNSYLKEIGIKDKQQDFVVELEQGYNYPKCLFSGDYLYQEECQNINNTKWNDQVQLINKQEDALEINPSKETTRMRIRFLNTGVMSPWRIYNNICSGMNQIKLCDNKSSNNTYQVPMEIIAVDGNDVERGVKVDNFFIGLANRFDVLIDITDHTKDIVITAFTSIKGDMGAYFRHIVIHGADNNSPVNATNLPKREKKGSGLNPRNPSSFDLVRQLHAINQLKQTNQSLREYSIIMRGGDANGGFPLSIYKGKISDGNDAKDILNGMNYLYPVTNFSQLNQLKYLLMPTKVWEHNKTKNRISSRRKCNNCALDYTDGLITKPLFGKPSFTFPSIFATKDTPVTERCCWEWCDIDEADCDNYKPIDVEVYKTNPHFIPVCYGDRVRITLMNYGSFITESHPIHLHGHDFVVTKLGNVTDNKVVMENIEDGPLMDTIWIQINDTVTFEFDAFNPGEHLLHCHKDFHLLNGMLTTVRYLNDKECKNSQGLLPTDFYPEG